MWIERKMKEMIDKYGKIPSVFSPYNLTDLSDGICSTLTTANCNGCTSPGSVLLNDSYINGKDNKKEYKENKMNYNLVNFCEFDKYAVKSYCAIHDTDESLNLDDITKVDIEELPTDVDLITHGSPCQSFSVAGKQHGGEKGSGTRSSLLWNSVEIIRHCKPKFVIWENVKNVLSKKHKSVFDAYVDEMKNMGYNTYYQVLNAKNYGIPQNRERIYAISVREDIDNNPNYTGHIDHNKYYDRSDCSLFPEPFDNGLRLKDFLEDEVEEKYYLKNTVNFFIKNSFVQEAKGNGFRFEPHVKDNAETAKTLTTRAGDRMDDNFVIDIDDDKTKFKFDSTNNRLNQIGYINSNSQGQRVYVTEGTSVTLSANGGGAGAKTGLYDVSEQDFRIRKLTPKECYRLMGFSDEDFEKAKATGNSATQLYKQAGNSIVVNVLEEIYKCLHNAYPNDFTKGMNVMSLFSGIGAFEKALERVDFD